jgi:predicted neutral ceramidase superfamily lipid hydrolase
VTAEDLTTIRELHTSLCKVQKIANEIYQPFFFLTISFIVYDSIFAVYTSTIAYDLYGQQLNRDFYAAFITNIVWGVSLISILAQHFWHCHEAHKEVLLRFPNALRRKSGRNS